MRHYLGYRANGSFASVHTFQGGWPLERDLCNADTTDEVTKKLRDGMLAEGEVVGFVCIDCACASEVGSCGCAGAEFAKNYVKDGVLTLRPTTTKIQLDGADVTDKARIARAPGTKVQFQLIAPDVPDGAKATVSIHKAILNLESQHELTITGGVSGTIELTAPAQGTEGRVLIGGIEVSVLMFDLVGFA